MEILFENLRENLKNVKSKVLGLAQVDFSKRKVIKYEFSVIEENIYTKYPFYFIPEKEHTEPNVVLIEKGEPITILRKDIYSLKELAQLVKTNRFIEELLKIDRNEVRKDAKLEEDLRDLMDLANLFDIIIPPLFSELTTFTFPQNLLDMIRGMVMVPYEACGSINISKLKPKPREKSIHIPSFKTTEEMLNFYKERQRQFSYDVSFHVDFPDHCDVTYMIGNDIAFHTHPSVKTSSFFNKPIVNQIEDFIHTVINLPSAADIGFTRQSLSTGQNQINMIFNFYGFYLFRYADINKEPEETYGLLTPEETDKYNNETYKLIYSTFYIGEKDLIDKAANTFEKEKDVDEHQDILKQVMINIGKKLNIGSYAEYDDPKTLENFLLENIDKLMDVYHNKALKLIEKYLNPNPSNNPIKVEYYFIQQENINKRWHYPQISVKLYPRLQRFAGIESRKRLTFQN